jgi:hypothetical protein
MPSAEVTILRASALDKQKWDACVAADASGLIYSQSWYLDCMADDWYGVVVNDYQVVMALPIKRKRGVRMVSIPPFTQRLGICGDSDKHVEKSVRDKVMRFSYLMRYASTGRQLFSKGAKKQRLNLVLPLQDSYQQIADRYNAACIKNLHKAQSRGCVLSTATVDDVIRLYRDAYGSTSTYTPAHYQQLESMLQTALQRKACHVASVKDEEGKMVYAGLLLDDGRRLYYVLGAPTAKGRHMRATYFFIDAMIRKFAGSGKTLDFEGSDISTVAQFYQSFSPQSEKYYDFYVNQYPFPINKLIDGVLKPF